MAFHDELLELAFDLATSQSKQNQAYYRRAISTAYYAVFHLLINQAVEHWDDPESRGALVRVFDHAHMRRVSPQVESANFAGAHPALIERMKLVCGTFVHLQGRRHRAD